MSIQETTPLLEEVAPVRIAQSVYTYQPGLQDGYKVDPSAPKLILIFGWMEAPVKHVAKYMSGYSKLYPGALQVLVRSTQSFYWSTKATKLERVRPIIKVLQDLGYFSGSPPNLLVHVFSDGGSGQLNLLSELIRDSYKLPIENMTLPATALVFDSLPGDGTLGPGLQAHTAAMRSRVLKYLSYIPLILLWSAIMGSSWLLGKHNPITRIRLGLNRADLLPWTNEKTPRVYIYSDTDKIILPKSVEEHAAEGRAKGLSVTTEKFKGTGHVNHMKQDPTRYWDIVSRAWAEALKVQSYLK